MSSDKVEVRRVPRMSVFEYEVKLHDKSKDALGREVPDPVPMQPPIGYKRQPSMVEIVRQQIHSENLRRLAEAEGYETFEEADDFDVADDYEPQSRYEAEEEFEPVSSLKDKRRKATAKPADGSRDGDELLGRGGRRNPAERDPAEPEGSESA